MFQIRTACCSFLDSTILYAWCSILHILYIVYTILYWNVHLADCTLGEVRLTSGTADPNFEELTNAGIVEICVNDTFGRVCNTGWTNRDVSVVCRELGFSPYGRYSNKPIRLAIANFLNNTWIPVQNSWLWPWPQYFDKFTEQLF